jgi:anthranilate phosphoribosyltransferase
MIAGSIRRLVEQASLSRHEMREAFAQIMDGIATDVQKSAFLVALRMKGETTEEVIGAATAMRERVIPIHIDAPHLVDTCGTGGDGSGTFNVSTVAAFVAAGAGATVAKHGNRAVSSSCGSADVLAALGVNLDLDAAQMTAVLRKSCIAFLFAPTLHPAMAAVVSVRRELGLRTIFNLLGPMTNPAAAKRQVLGVYSPHLVPMVAEALLALGSEHVLVVHGADGVDEISISAETIVAEVVDGEVREFRIDPERLGLRRFDRAAIGGGDVAVNVEIARAVLGGAEGAEREIVLANAGAAIYVSGLAASLREGVEAARASIDRGAAAEKLETLIRETRQHGAGG